MVETDILFRKAVESDSKFICKAVLAALGIADFIADNDKDGADVLTLLNDVVLMDDTLYSVRNTLVAEVDGVCAGCIIAYDGGRYEDMRKKTSTMLNAQWKQYYENTEAETRAGEYYLDTLAVDPKFRHKGIGRQLIYQALETGEALGFDIASLLVLASDNGLRAMYSSCGFKADRNVRCFDNEYLRMVSILH